MSQFVSILFPKIRNALFEKISQFARQKSYFVGNPNGDTHVRGRDIGREKRSIEIGRGRERIGIEIRGMEW